MNDTVPDWMKETIKMRKEAVDIELKNLTSNTPIRTREELLTVVQDGSQSQNQFNYKDTVNRVIIAADRLFDENNSEYRSYCPLCGQGTTTAYHIPYPEKRGFKLPEGLRRHLTGYGNTHECEVMQETRVLYRKNTD